MKSNKKNKLSEKKIIEEIKIPEGIIAKIEDNILIMTKNEKRLERKLNQLIGIKIKEDKIIIKSNKSLKKNKKIFGTTNAHIKNMIKGLTQGFRYKLQIANVHFPMSVSYDKENNKVIVKNFLGEKKDRKINTIKGVDIKINKDIIELESVDIEKAGQVAANLEKGTKVRNKDRRIFQDGIFITKKPEREFK